jgi:hypothetical protein
VTDAEAEAMLAQLSAHYKVPVMPIERYCAGLRTWQQALHDRARRVQDDLWPGLYGASYEAHEAVRKEREASKKKSPLERDERDSAITRLERFEEDAKAIDRVFLMISKSCLLDRMLYGGEPLRVTMCPDHKGTWQGIDWHGDACKHGCGLTGWIPAPSGVTVTGAIPSGDDPGSR